MDRRNLLTPTILSAILATTPSRKWQRRTTLRPRPSNRCVALWFSSFTYPSLEFLSKWGLWGHHNWNTWARRFIIHVLIRCLSILWCFRASGFGSVIHKWDWSKPEEHVIEPPSHNPELYKISCTQWKN